MKVCLSDLNPTKEVTISGDEAWLSSIYRDFAPGPDGKDREADSSEGQDAKAALSDWTSPSSS